MRPWCAFDDNNGSNDTDDDNNSNKFLCRSAKGLFDPSPLNTKQTVRGGQKQTQATHSAGRNSWKTLISDVSGFVDFPGYFVAVGAQRWWYVTASVVGKAVFVLRIDVVID